MKYYAVRPEIAGGFGMGTDLETSAYPPTVTNLNFEFDGWIGDSILESFPIYLATEELCRKFERENLTGFESDHVTITRSKAFNELQQNTPLPDFKWLKITGKSMQDDFGIGNDYILTVSQKVADILISEKLRDCSIEEITYY